MTDTLLRTKLYTPPVRPFLVPRSHLIAKLNKGLNTKLTLVSAPAGFGKTTLLSEFITACRRPAAWVSLDKGDNDPARFLAYCIQALQQINEGIGETVFSALQSPHLPPVEAILTGLINEITEIREHFALVLDDYHVIREQQVHEAVIFLVNNQPSQMHLVLSTRADPPWPLARLRVRHEIAELRTNDLRFTFEETTTFLNDVMRLRLPAAAVVALRERTEGWIAGLQMAALAMQSPFSLGERKDVSEFIDAFTGGHHFIFDYLVEEVLEQQPAGIQEFLLKTSILERMTAGLCDAVLGRRDCRPILAQLERCNMFIVPLDDERHW